MARPTLQANNLGKVRTWNLWSSLSFTNSKLQHKWQGCFPTTKKSMIMFFLADHSCGGPRLVSYRKTTTRLDPWILNIKLTKIQWRTCKAGAAWWGFLSTPPGPLFFSSESPALSSALGFSPPENAQLPKEGVRGQWLDNPLKGMLCFLSISKSTVCLPCGDLHPPASACRSVWVSPPNRSSPAPVSESPP